MQGLRIKDLAEGRYLAFDLKEVLATIGEPARSSRWLCTDLWCIPKNSVDEPGLMAQYDTGSFVAGEDLMTLAAQTRQVVDGTFRGFGTGAEQPWIVIRAVDSTFWEVFATKSEVLDRLRARFHDVEDLPEDAA